MSLQVFICGGTRYRIDESEALDYDPKVRFREGDTLRHARFGLGLVIEEGESGVGVQFPDRRARLVHRRA